VASRLELFAQNVNAGMSDAEAARRAGYSESYSAKQAHIIRANAEKRGLLHTKATAERVRDAMEDVLAGDDEELRAMLAALRDKAKGGDVSALREVLDRLLGRPSQHVDVTSAGDSLTIPWPHYVTDDDDNVT